MASELQSLSDLFQKRLFRIPDYQRGYAWKQSQLVDFWDDLINLNKDRYHYTGLLSLKTLNRKEVASWGKDLWILKKGFNPCHIVDGQQRLTTFVILLNEIICFVRQLDENQGLSDKDIVINAETLKEIVDKYICQSQPPQHLITTYLFGYEVDSPTAEYLKYKVFNEPHSGSIRETYYTKNLKYAKEFFSENVRGYYNTYGIEGITEIYQKLTQRLMFNIHEIEDDYDVFVAFETMNNRGKKLTNLELLKNRLIYLTTIYENGELDDLNKKALRKDINDAWKEVYYQLGRNKTTPLSDDDFLRAHWILYFSYSRKRGDDYVRFLLSKFSAKNVFSKKTIVIDEELSVNTVDDEQPADDEDQMLEGSEPEIKTVSQLAPKEIQNYVLSLKGSAKFWYDTFFPYESDTLNEDEKVWIDRLNRIGIGYFRPMVMAALSINTSASKRVDLFRAIERFLFVCFRLGGYQATYRSSEYYRATRSLRVGELSLEEITRDINETVEQNIKYNIPEFINRIKKKFDSGEGYYGWGPLKYFLYEYEYSLAEKLNATRKISWELFTKTEKDRVSIEHILPQTATKFYWRNMFRQFSPEEIKTLSGTIGNLLPLSQSVNSSLQNDSFEDKKRSTAKGRRGYENGSHSEIEVSKKPDWDAEQIYDRSLHLLSFMETRWNILLTDEQKIELIHIGFVKDGREIPAALDESVYLDSTESEGSENEDAKCRYWEYALPIIKEHVVINGNEPYANIKPSSSASKDGFFGIGGIHLFCSIKQRPPKCSAGFWIDAGEQSASRAIFNVLLTHKQEIESKMSVPIEWTCKDKNRACSITATLAGDYRNPDEWPILASFQARTCKEFAIYAFYPYEEEIRAALK